MRDRQFEKRGKQVGSTNKIFLHLTLHSLTLSLSRIEVKKNVIRGFIANESIALPMKIASRLVANSIIACAPVYLDYNRLDRIHKCQIFAIRF